MRSATDGGRLIAGRYALQDVIGRGGMSSVWLGRDEVLERDVALKPLGLLPGQEPQRLERHVALEHLVPAQPDAAHPASADHAAQRVPPGDETSPVRR